MNHADKERLAFTNDTGLMACAIRLRAARSVTGKQANVLAKECGVSKTVYSNAENGVSYPNRELMKHLYRAYRIDFNFMINGDFAQLPGDIQDALFPALEAAKNEWDRRSNSDQD
ncbi:MAG: helix-turn-helix domain-containing protein [Heliomarina sp.]|uniref:helix-turn-helix domain-containing protein n=1 Tax=Heliomarina sp. TaxID=2917556 RepID=UPI0040589927